jgi:hypothetical protein
MTTHQTGLGPLLDSNDQLPRLIELPKVVGRQREILQRLQTDALEVGGLPPLLVLLRSKASADTVRAHIGRAQLAQNTAGGQSWLRVHDPRVWVQLTRILTSSQFSSLLGPIESWTLRFQGAWYRHDRPDVRSTTSRFERHTWLALERIGVVNRVLAKLEPEVRAFPALRARSELIDSAIERAMVIHGLRRQEDLVDFGVLAMSVHPAFDQHPEVATLLVSRPTSQAKRADPDKQTAMDQLRSQSPSFWQMVKSSLSPPEEAMKEA